MKSQITIAAIMLSLSPFSIGAGIQTQMDQMFTSMQNYTQPGAFETQQRGGVQGGRFTYKQQIWNQNLVTFVPPSARGGCGGIDVFGGSFSFINSDQLVQLMRSVASNASTYAFTIAMDAACPQCMQWMNDLQSKVAEMNSHLSDSCQLAQGIVNDTTAALFDKENKDQSIKATLDGFADDFSDVSNHISDVRTAFKRNYDADAVGTTADSIGAVLYKKLKEQNFATWFIGGDSSMLEFVISVVGTPVLTEPTQDEAAQGDQFGVRMAGRITDLSKLFSLLADGDGTETIELYDCSIAAAKPNGVDVCLIPQAGGTKTQAITGIKTKILDYIVGANGLVTNAKLGQLKPVYSQQQKNVLAGLPAHLNSKIHRLVELNPEAARTFAEQNIDAIVTDYIDHMVTQVVQATQAAINTPSKYDKMYKEQMQINIDRFRVDWAKERAARQRLGKTSDIDEKFQATLAILSKPKMVVTPSNN